MAFPRRPKLRQYQTQLTRKFVNPQLYTQLKNELRVLAKARPPEEIDEPKQQLAPVLKSASTQQKEAPEEVPESVYALRRRARPLHKRFDAVRADIRNVSKMDLSETEKVALRLPMCEELMGVIQPELDNIYTQIRQFKKTGEAPPHPDMEDMRDQIAREVCEYERLHNYAKRNPLSDEQKARLSELRKRYNKVREASYKKTK